MDFPKIKLKVLFIFFASGLASMALEIVWFRMLSLFIPTTTYAFSIMLAAVLSGITIGSFVTHVLLKSKGRLRNLLIIFEMGIALFILLSLLGLEAIYPLLRTLRLGNNLLLMVVASFLAIFPSTLIMGMAFPLGLKVWEGKEGFFYGINVTGSILGTLVGGFFLLPYLGSYISLILLSFVFLASSLWITDRLIVKLAILTPWLILALLVPDYYPTVITYRYPGEKLLWFQEGIQTTVSVHENKEGFRVMYMDGRHQAEDSPRVVEIHRQIGYLPMALHRNPRQALVIGLGGGATAGEIAKNPNTRVDVVELADSVIKAASWFKHVNNQVLEQPNVKLIIGDGRNYLMLTRQKYDIVTADIIQPNHAGAGNLYSVEYFQLVKKVLREEGIVLQWIGKRAVSQYKAIMRTFLNVFPNATLWADGTLLVGSQEAVDVQTLPHELQKLYTAGPKQLHDFVGPGPILTDNRPFVEYYFLSLPKDETEIVQLPPPQ